MKKASTAGAKQTNHFAGQKLTIGLDLGDRSSWYCMLDAAGEVLQEQKVGTTPKAMADRVRGHAVLPDRLGNGEALAVGEPVVERTRS
jgi:hypothetical protein